MAHKNVVKMYTRLGIDRQLVVEFKSARPEQCLESEFQQRQLEQQQQEQHEQ